MLDIVDRFEAEAVSSWKKNGGNVIELSDAHKKQYMHDAQLVADEVFGKNPEVKKMYELLKATAARHKKG
jgi:hypothetical protein